MKFASRPKKSPNVTEAAQTSNSESIGNPSPQREHRHGDDHAGQPAVERHAAFPEAEEAERVVEEMAGLIEERVAEAPAGDDADDEPEQEIVDVRAASAARLVRPTGGRSTTRRRAYHQPIRMPAK